MPRNPGLRAAPLRVVPARVPQGVRTPLDYLHWAWRQVPPKDRLAFLAEMLTPNERRVLQYGFEDAEDAGA